MHARGVHLSPPRFFYPINHTCSHQKLEAIPEQVTGLSCLTRLALSACSLGELAPGPYLRGLRELVLFANNLRQAGLVGDWRCELRLHFSRNRACSLALGHFQPRPHPAAAACRRRWRTRNGAPPCCATWTCPPTTITS